MRKYTFSSHSDQMLRLNNCLNDSFHIVVVRVKKKHKKSENHEHRHRYSAIAEG